MKKQILNWNLQPRKLRRVLQQQQGRRDGHAPREAEELPGRPRHLARGPDAADDVRQHEEDDKDSRDRQHREHDERVGEADCEEGAAARR